MMTSAGGDATVETVTMTPCSDAICYVNGTLVSDTVTLRTGSRVIFGRNHVFRFMQPNQGRSTAHLRLVLLRPRYGSGVLWWACLSVCLCVRLCVRVCVCVRVCLSAIISSELHVRSSPTFVHVTYGLLHGYTHGVEEMEDRRKDGLMTFVMTVWASEFQYRKLLI